MAEENSMETLMIDDTEYQTTLTKKFAGRKKFTPPDKSKVLVFIPGVVRDIFVRPGQQIKRGSPLLILEAMKMKNEILSERDGIVKAIYATSGHVVIKGELLLEFED